MQFASRVFLEASVRFFFGLEQNNFDTKTINVPFFIRSIFVRGTLPLFRFIPAIFAYFLPARFNRRLLHSRTFLHLHLHHFIHLVPGRITLPWMLAAKIVFKNVSDANNYGR